MSHAEPINIANEQVHLGARAGTLYKLTGIVALAAFGGGVALAFTTNNMNQFLRAYLVAFAFFLSVGLGSLFFVLVQHLTHAGWSVVVRRLAELLMFSLPVLAVLSVPIILGAPLIYEWVDWTAHPEAHHLTEGMIAKRDGWLNPTLFTARIAIYFVIWATLAWLLFRRSVRQDSNGDPQETRRNEFTSAPGILLFAISLTLGSFDLLKSAEPEWFSTIFGVYYFAGSVGCAFATITLFAMFIQRLGFLKNAITTEHYHDLGKLIFAFVVFWGYIAFSQYMLIWYANMPEETFWYFSRASADSGTSRWQIVAWVVLFGHLIIPLLGLLSRHVKRNRMLLAFWAVWMLVMHWVDLYWIVTPAITEGTMVVNNETVAAPTAPFGPHLLFDLLCMVGMFGAIATAVFWRARNVALVPLKDPRLNESLKFENF